MSVKVNVSVRLCNSHQKGSSILSLGGFVYREPERINLTVGKNSQTARMWHKVLAGALPASVALNYYWNSGETYSFPTSDRRNVDIMFISIRSPCLYTEKKCDDLVCTIVCAPFPFLLHKQTGACLWRLTSVIVCSVHIRIEFPPTDMLLCKSTLLIVFYSTQDESVWCISS